MAPINVDDVGRLLQWKLKKQLTKLSDEAQVQIAQDLLSSSSQLDAVEAALNIPRPRLLRAVLEWAVHMATKASSDDASTAARAFDVLASALTQTSGYQLQLPLQSCTQLLQAMTIVVSASESVLPSVLCVFVHLFENTSAASFAPQFGVFKPPTDVYTTFLHTTLRTLVARPPSETARDLMLVILRVSHVLQKHQSNKKKVFLASKQSLSSFMGLRASLIAGDADYAAPIVHLLDTMVGDALFDVEHLFGYDKLHTATSVWQLSSSDAPPAKKAKLAPKTAKIAMAYQEQLFAELQAQLQPDAAHAYAAADFAAMLVAQFTSRIRSQTEKRKAPDAVTPAFAFWLELIAVSIRLPTTNDAYPIQMRVLRTLWAAMNSSEIYRVAEDNARQDQLQYLERVVSSIMGLVKADNSACIPDETTLLSSMVECSPKILQAHLPQVFALLSKKATSDVDASAECLRHLLHSYDAVRLLQDLLSALFATTNAAPLTRLFRHAALDAMLRTACNNVPAGQLESIWLFFHDALRAGMDNTATLQLVRTVFGTFLQEVQVSQHNREMFEARAKDSFEVLVRPALEHVDDAVARQLLSLAGDLLELTDKSLDMQYVLDAIFAADDMGTTLHRLASTEQNDDDPSLALHGLLKLAATRVRFLTSGGAGGDEAASMAAFVLGNCGAEWACITPFLTELGHAAPADVSSAFMETVCRQSIAAPASSSLFLDAAFYEIRPFLNVVPTVFVQLLATSVGALASSSKASARLAKLARRIATPAEHPAFLEALARVSLPASAVAATDLEATLTFLAAVPIPYIPSPATTLLLCTMLRLELLLADTTTASTAIHTWLTTYFDATTHALEAASIEALDHWLPLVLGRATLSGGTDHMLGAFGRCVAKVHPTLLHRMLSVVSARATADGMTTTVRQLLSRALQCCSIAKSKHVEAFWADAIHPRVARLVATESLTSDALDLFASILHFHELKHKTDNDVHASVGKVLAAACRHVTSGDDAAAVVASEAVLRTIAVHYKSLSKTLHFALPVFGALLGACLVASPSTTISTAVEALLDHCNDAEFALVWSTLQHELLHGDETRVTASLRATLLFLQTDKLHGHRHLLSASAKHVLASVVDLANAQYGASTHVLALQVVAQLLTKQDAFHWHASDVQLGLLVLRPLLSLAAAEALPAIDDVHQIWTSAYTVLLRVLRQHSASLPVFLPHYVLGCNALLRLVLRVGKDAKVTKELLVWASNLTRLYGYMIPHGVSFRKHMVYMLAEYFKQTDALPHDVTETLRPGIYALFDICSKYEKDQLFGTLDATGKVLLKSMDTHYKETHQYTGKV
ncbi:hypothetical protein SPRG_10593 [Saprolegnia parasitica CBS 223.65]|uniref:Nucleolar 27S pre-rRNA processing Urb2/Npa2 C-terminal domain-containing protein n=1 Tax=Saprolegnia parasitica (strain CBS 223.65) TaxID=695850 RepID=A0A067C4Y4_SAPPC|nr:hypothetical protein SPRG_10593 [Saprolegnia parasitica CBS 223.65]KDO24165.1 hypothetical protein SPRG_10593 [Saprolegnia parasitica CBS 223.65]|eukprot:XP_012205109.1 hypothetical protein SPRG_10593 [Saprolegnia parasitica CBS 223.65]